MVKIRHRVTQIIEIIGVALITNITHVRLCTLRMCIRCVREIFAKKRHPFSTYFASLTMGVAFKGKNLTLPNIGATLYGKNLFPLPVHNIFRVQKKKKKKKKKTQKKNKKKTTKKTTTKQQQPRPPLKKKQKKKKQKKKRHIKRS